MGTPAINDEVLTIGSEKTNDQISINFNTLRRSVLTLRAINHQLRQEIISLLDKDGRMTVTDIYVKLRLEQSVASQHLAILRRAGVLKTERDGKFIYYSVNNDRLKEISSFIEDLVNS
ncbi:MAG: helix-turn-helix transcriptional regulator [Bacteroidetes bacterium]|nr:helix-turn-helix transcriptional regulator [Bacteroidota bacterium]